MLWIGNQITAGQIIKMLFLPSVVCLLLPLIIVSFRLKGVIQPSSKNTNHTLRPKFERTLVFCLGIGILLFVPIFKTVTHLPPFMAILFGLGVLWIATEILHKQKDDDEKIA